MDAVFKALADPARPGPPKLRANCSFGVETHPDWTAGSS
jgi:hypothetical protein